MEKIGKKSNLSSKHAVDHKLDHMHKNTSIKYKDN
jgi:hypothetical protein